MHSKNKSRGACVWMLQGCTRIKYIFLVATGFGAICGLHSCKKNEAALYSGNESVYFANFTNTDSASFSFVGSPKKTDTVFLNIQLLGNALSAAKKYKIVADPALSTAKEGIHYRKMNDYDTFPASVFTTKFPVVVYNTDTSLLTKTYSLVLNIVATDELGTAYPNKQKVKLNITNQYVMPVYWASYLNLYYGPYSRVKHQVCVQLQGVNFPATLVEAKASPYGPSFWMSWGRVADQYFTTNRVNDENNNLIQPWPAF